MKYIELTKTFATNTNSSDSVSSVEFHSDGSQVYCGTFRGLIYVCDVNTGKGNFDFTSLKKVSWACIRGYFDM